MLTIALPERALSWFPFTSQLFPHECDSTALKIIKVASLLSGVSLVLLPFTLIADGIYALCFANLRRAPLLPDIPKPIVNRAPLPPPLEIPVMAPLPLLLPIEPVPPQPKPAPAPSSVWRACFLGWMILCTATLFRREKKVETFKVPSMLLLPSHSSLPARVFLGEQSGPSFEMRPHFQPPDVRMAKDAFDRLSRLIRIEDTSVAVVRVDSPVAFCSVEPKKAPMPPLLLLPSPVEPIKMRTIEMVRPLRQQKDLMSRLVPVAKSTGLFLLCWGAMKIKAWVAQAFQRLNQPRIEPIVHHQFLMKGSRLRDPTPRTGRMTPEQKQIADLQERLTRAQSERPQQNQEPQLKSEELTPEQKQLVAALESATQVERDNSSELEGLNKRIQELQTERDKYITDNQQLARGKESAESNLANEREKLAAAESRLAKSLLSLKKAEESWHAMEKKSREEREELELQVWRLGEELKTKIEKPQKSSASSSKAEQAVEPDASSCGENLSHQISQLKRQIVDLQRKIQEVQDLKDEDARVFNGKRLLLEAEILKFKDEVARGQ